MNKLTDIVKKVYKLLSIGICAAMIGCASTIPRTVSEQKIEQEKLENKGYEKKYSTIAHTCLELERKVGANDLDVKVLDHIIDRANKVIDKKGKDETKRAIKNLYNINTIIKKEGFAYKENNIFSKGMRVQEDGKRYLDCDGFSLLYKAIGEAARLPIEMISVPRHVFVRYYLNNGSYFNWEAVNPDVFADTKYGIHKNSLKNSRYLRCMGKDEILGLCMTNIGHFISEKKDDPYWAMNYYDLALHFNPESVCALLSRGLLYKADSLAEYAMEDFQAALNIDPYNKSALGLVAREHFGNKNYDKALKYLEKLVEIDSLSATNHFNLGIVYAEKKQHLKAANSFFKAIELDPLHIKAYYNAGQVLLDMEFYKLSAYNYKRALELEPDLHTCYCLAFAYYKSKQYNKVLETCDRMLEMDSTYSEAYRFKADVYEDLKKYPSAVDAYYEAAHLDNNDSYSFYRIASILSGHEKYENAIDYYDKAIYRDLFYVEAYIGKAEALDKLGRIKEAFETYKEAKRANPNHPKTRNMVFIE